MSPKSPYLGIFGLKFEKIVIFGISILEIIKNDFLTNAVNIDIGSVFTKYPGFNFSEGLDPGPSPIYKVCRISLFFVCFACT